MPESPADETSVYPSAGARWVGEDGLEPLLREAEEEVGKIANIAGLEPTSCIDGLRELRERLGERRFHLAVLGQFKRGKSTLLNALLGEQVLPTSVLPLTSVPTFIRKGARRGVEIETEGEEGTISRGDLKAEELAKLLRRHVTENENPHNTLGVRRVEVTHPAPLLAKDLILIDTPGVGSAHRHNTEATLEFLSECDAALFLLSADPPITEAELDFLHKVREVVPRLFFLLNKIDYLSAEEVGEVEAYLRRTLVEAGRVEREPEIYAVSARRALEARSEGNQEGWRKSGMGHVESELLDFVIEEKDRLLCRALARRASSLVEDQIFDARLALRAEEMSLEEIEEKLTLFESKVEAMRYERTVAGDLVGGERRRLVEELEERAASLRREAQAHLGAVLEDAFSGEDGSEEGARRELEEEIPDFFSASSRAAARAFETRVREVLELHQRRSDELIARVREAAAETFSLAAASVTEEIRLEERHQPYWVSRHWASTLNPIPPGWFDPFFPRSLRRRRQLRRLRRELESLVRSNVENLRWSTLQNLDDLFRRFARRQDERLDEAIGSTLGAIRGQLEARRRGDEELKARRQSLGAAIARLESLNARLAPAETE